MLEDRLAWPCSSVPSRPPVTSPSCHRGIVMTGGVLLPAGGIAARYLPPPADRNPEIVDQIVFPLGAAASDLEPIAGRSVNEVVGAGGNAAPDLNRSGCGDDRRTRRERHHSGGTGSGRGTASRRTHWTRRPRRRCDSAQVGPLSGGRVRPNSWSSR